MSRKWVQAVSAILISFVLSISPLAGSLIWAISAAQAASIPATDDEFVGPFVSWVNVKTVYGAKGDGVTDDTAPIENALNAVGTGSTSPVLWFPAGTYRITGTLTLSNRQNIALLGQDPSTTIIKWAGASGGTMLYVNGVAYSRISRLTFDGSSSAGINVDQSWDGSTGSFDTHNEYADDTFQYAGTGLRGGALGNGFAETSVIRDHFISNTNYGISLGNFNALDLWVRHSTFNHCGTGITNTQGAGNFKVYNSNFQYSVNADMSMGNTGQFSIRQNYSYGSKQFFYAGATGNAAGVIFQKNTILDTTNSQSISIGNQGPVLMSDNVIRSLGSSGPVISVSSSPDADIIAVGNTVTVSNPFSANGRLDEIGTSVVSASNISSVAATLPGTEPNMNRQVFDVPAGASAATIQQAINSAAAQNGNRPVVHLPAGTYNISQTLTIPANSDLQLVGDGSNTSLSWSGSSGGQVVKISGPSQATLRYFQINGNNSAEGIVASGIDQSGARVFMHGMDLTSGTQTNLYADSMDYTDVEAEDFNHAYQNSGTSIKVVGGALAAAGNPQTGKVNIYSGSSTGENLPYSVSSGGTLLARDIWYDASGSSPAFMNVSGRAAATLEGLAVNVPVTGQTTPAFTISNLTGKVSLLDLWLLDRVIISGSGSAAQVLGAGLQAGYVPTSSYFQNNASPAATAGLVESRQNTSSGGTVETPNAGTIDNTFVTAMLAQTRAATPQPVTALPSGVTDLRMYRVYVTQGTNNIHLIGGGGSTNPAPTASLSVNPTSITSGQSSTLAWSSTNATSCTGTGFSTSNATSGSVSVTPPTTTTYSVTCTGSGGTANASATVTVSSGSSSNSFQHVVVVLFENTNYSSVVGNSSAPYFNSLANTYGISTQYYANTHPSIGNYFELTTGQVLTNDDTQTPSSFPVSADNVVRRMLNSGKTWKAYEESLPSIGYTGGDVYPYVVHHVPLAYITDVQNSSTQRNNLVPFEDTNVGFLHDVNNGALPAYSFITPNSCNNAHDCSLSTADSWLQSNVGPLINNSTLMQNTLVLVLFDESSNDNANGGGRVYLVAASPKVKSAYKSTAFYQHQSTLRETLEGLGLAYNLADAGTAPSMGEFFTTGTPAPTASLSANPTSITSGQSSTLTWSSTNATSCTGTGFSTGNAVSGSVSVSPTATTHYSVSCTGSGGTASASATVTVGAASNGLIGWWKFDEGSGTTASDSSGSGNTGTLQNGAAWTTGKTGSAVSLNGSQNQSVQITGLLGTPPSLTLAGWANLTASGSSGSELVSLGDTAAIRLSNTATSFFWQSSSGSWAFVTQAQSYLGVGWHHFAATMDASGKTATLYVDGVQAATMSNASPITYSGLGANTFIGHHGNRSGSYNFTGFIDDARVYNRALSASEVQALYSGASSTAPTATLSANPTSITSGQSSTLTWSSMNASSCTGTGFSTGNAVSGSVTVKPSTATTYSVSCTGSGGTAKASTTLTVTADTTPPSVPTGLTATAVSSSQINLTWIASMDNIGVTGYKIYRNGTQVGTSNTTNDSDTGLAQSTSYSYAVAAYDAAGNTAAQSSAVSALTQPVIATIGVGSRVVTTANLNVRQTAGAGGTKLGTQSVGARGTVAAGPTTADGYTWWQITYDNAPSGWSIANYLSPAQTQSSPALGLAPVSVGPKTRTLIAQMGQ
jgi:Concanavalin A-like lectin/glucanases superfamily/Phosphoesterase family/Pectate lyase superfamily protein